MNIDPNGNRPKLKKIKRPINRTAPIDNTQSQFSGNVPPRAVQPQMQQQSSLQSDSGSFQMKTPSSNDLNNYLDRPTNLPDTRVQNANQIPNFIEEEEYYDNQPYSDVPEWLNTKVFIAAIIACLVIGMLAGKLFFTQSTVVRNGLQGVVVNAEVPRGRARCGIAERSQGCVLYIMNPQRQEMAAKDFYDLASQVTGRQRFMIETGNMRYANSKIKPGDIVQLNIPPL